MGDVIIPWAQSGAWNVNTKIAGQYVLNVGVTVEQKDTTPKSAISSGNSTTTFGYLQNANLWLQFRKTNFWGLVPVISDSTSSFYVVRLWEVNTGIWQGLPTKTGRPSNNDFTYAGWFKGETQPLTENPQYLAPVFRPYPRTYGSGGDYFEILSTSEKNQFVIKSNFYAPGGYQAPNAATWPSVKPSTGNGGTGAGGRIRPEPGIGAGSGTGVTTGNQPYEGGWQPDGSVYVPGIGTFRPPVATGGSGGGSRGAWVTAPDGTRVWLPRGTDFSKLKPPTPPEPKPETKIVVRMPKGYSAPQATAGTKPRMSQSYYEPLKEADKNPYTLGLLNGAPGILKTRTFVFPYIPQSIRYSDMGSEWQEIPRALNVPFVDWTRYKLMKVSMDFLVAAQFKPNPSVASTVSDGLQTDVTEELNLLRAMANSKNPVFLEGFDDILQMQLARSVNDVPRGMQFVINDLNIVAARRTIDPDTGLATTPSKIAAAQVSITLQEIPVETVTLVKLPPLDLGTPLVGKPGGPGTGTNNLGLQSSVLTGWEI